MSAIQDRKNLLDFSNPFAYNINNDKATVNKPLDKVVKFALDLVRRFKYNINNRKAIKFNEQFKEKIIMEKAKVVNYTAELTAEIVEKYKAGESVESIAKFAGKTTRSIVAKLSREGVYVAKAKTKGEARVKKDELVKEIAAFIGTDEEKLDSLEKATAEALTLVLNALKGE